MRKKGREGKIGTRENRRRRRALYYLFYDARIHGRTEKGEYCYDTRVEEEQQKRGKKQQTTTTNGNINNKAVNSTQSEG